MSRILFLLLGSIIIAGRVSATEIPGRIDLPEFEKESLLNGLEILFLPQAEGESHFLLMIRNGAAFDPSDKWGVSWLTANLMKERTESRTPEQLRFDLEQAGAVVDLEVSHDAIIFKGRAPAARIGDALALVADMVVRPVFEEEAFEQMRRQLLEDRRQESAKAEGLTQDLLTREIYGYNPYGHSVRGTPETLQNVTLNDVKIQYRRLFMPNQAQLALEGPADREKLYRSLSRSWGGWVRRKPLPFTFRRASAPESTSILLHDAEGPEAIMRWGRLGIKKGGRGFHALKVLEQYLLLLLPDWADAGSQSQIQAYPEIVTRRMPGHFQLSVKASPEKVLQYFDRFKGLVVDLRAGKIDLDLLEEARGLALQDFRDQLRSRETRMRILLDMTLYEVGAGYVTTFGLRLGRVTPENFRAEVESQLTMDNFVMVVAGPASELADQLRKFGELQIVGR